jgi:hypothetical protein
MQTAEAAPPSPVAETKAGSTISKSGKGVLNSTVLSPDKKPVYKSYQRDE